jgi:hypothetical protein
VPCAIQAVQPVLGPIDSSEFAADAVLVDVVRVDVAMDTLDGLAAVAAFAASVAFAAFGTVAAVEGSTCWVDYSPDSALLAGAFPLGWQTQ